MYLRINIEFVYCGIVIYLVLLETMLSMPIVVCIKNKTFKTLIGIRNIFVHTVKCNVHRTKYRN